MKKDDNRDYKREMIERICSDLRIRAQEIHEDASIDVKDQLTQMDVIWNMFKVLAHYDENMAVLQQYSYKKNERKRFMRGRDIDE